MDNGELYTMYIDINYSSNKFRKAISKHFDLANIHRSYHIHCMRLTHCNLWDMDEFTWLLILKLISRINILFSLKLPSCEYKKTLFMINQHFDLANIHRPYHIHCMRLSHCHLWDMAEFTWLLILKLISRIDILFSLKLPSCEYKKTLFMINQHYFR